MTTALRLLVLACALVLLHAAPSLAAPTNTTPPSVTGTPQDGETLTAVDGVWSPAGTVTTTRVWQRCLLLDDCTDIPGAVGETYTLTPADVGFTIRIAVTATDSADSGTAVMNSPEVGPVLADPPVNTAAPQITGTALVGQTLTTSNGTWTGTPTIDFSYQWQRCTAPGTCANIGGATGSTYQLVTTDFEHTIRAIVTADNDGGTADATSAESAPVESAPFNTTPPSLSGTLIDGETLTADPGVWDGTPTIGFSYQWQRCNPGCSNITSATTASYALGHDDVGATIRVRVTASNGHGSADLLAATSDTIDAAPPSNIELPTIDDTTPVVGQQLTALTADADWNGTPPFEYEHQWQKCASPGVCTNIPGATDATYTPDEDDFGATLRVLVTAENGAGNDTAVSAETAAAESAPFNETLPTVTGTARDGLTLTGTDGTFDGSAPIATERNWQRCTGGSATCTDITGATGSSYVLTHADVGLTIRLRVHASNTLGAVDAFSAQTATVAKEPPTPIESQKPTITVPGGGAPRSGQELTAVSNQADWNGTPPFEFSYQWRRCDTIDGCSDIGGATGQNYTVQNADFGDTLHVRVTASNGAPPTATAVSADTAPVEAAPFATALPTVSGTARDGETVTSTEGTWSGNESTRVRNWQRCTPTCTDIVGATGADYTLTPADVGAAVRVRVTATNTIGSTDAFSAQTATVAAIPPSNTAPPALPAAAPVVGQPVTVTPGSWTGSTPIGISHQWQRCDPACEDIAGATGTSYTPQTAEFGATLRVVETASNGPPVATVPAQSAESAAVESAPFATAVPTISGDATYGAELSVASAGTWNGTGPIGDPAYQWQRCTTTCSNIATATDDSYRLSSADVGRTVRVVVTRSNTHGAGTSPSAESGTVAAVAPTPNSPPSISGTPVDGELLVADEGGWDGSSATFGYRWQRCDALSTCVDIGGATGQTYRPTAADVGSRIRVAVTATNSAGSGSAESGMTDAVAARAPGNRVPPSIAGSAAIGQTLSSSDGQWDGTPPVGISRTWQRCDAAGNSCADTGVTGSTYGVGGGDVGSTLRLRVTASGPGGANTAHSAPTAVVSANAGPRAAFVFHPRRPTTSDTIALTSTSTDPDGAIVSLTWDTDNDGRFDDGSGVEASVRFRRAGKQDVSLRVVDSLGAVDTVTRTINVRRPDRLISPFPVVRIVGGATTRGARIRTLIVRAPRGARVTVRCKGRCPARRQVKAVKSGSARFKRFERSLVAGTVLEVFVTQRDRIGKFTRFQIRRAKSPKRTDRCLMPGSSKPTRCPQS